MFITIEGLDGSGKKYHASWMADWLSNIGENVLSISDGGTEIGKKLLGTLEESTKQLAESELLIRSAIHAQMAGELILPHIEVGGTVVSEGYIDAVYVQALAQGLDPRIIQEVTEFSIRGLYPDISVLFDIRTEKPEYAKIRAGYLAVVKRDPKRWLVINPQEEPERIKSILKGIITNKLRERKICRMRQS
jgi:dTMP kinase